MDFPANPRLLIDGAALVANWRQLARLGGAAACGAAVKADGYGLGARAVVERLAHAGCRDFYVSSWAEAAALRTMPGGATLAVLHGVQPAEMTAARTSNALPVLCSAAQVAAWRASSGGRCDVMVDTGINRLGLTPAEALSGLLDGLDVETLHSHLACAETSGHSHNARQLAAFRTVVQGVPARRYSLANSAGIALGADYCFDLTRPGIGLYGGNQAPGLAPVARLEARVVQVRDLAAGDSVGYGASYTATAPGRVAVLGIGYADGYPRALSNRGAALVAGIRCPVVGRVSMDLMAIDVSAAPPVAEGGWVALDFDLASVAAATGRSQYELLTGLGHRYSRVWT